MATRPLTVVAPASAAASSTETIRPNGFKWLFNGREWSQKADSKHDQLRLEEGSTPQRLITWSRANAQEQDVHLWYVINGRSLKEAGS